LTRSELIAELAAANPLLRGKDVAATVTTIFDSIAAALARGDKVKLRSFGAFAIRRRDRRAGRNPRTGEAVSVEAKSAPFFNAGQELLLRVNAGGNHPNGP
jgi:integration host factor subunit beta